MSLEDVKKLFKTYKTDIKNVVVHLLEEDKKFIDLYSSLSTNNMSLQYETLKYLIVAQMYDELLKKSVFNLKNEKNVEESLNEINQFHEEDIVEFLHSQDEDEVQWLNKLAIMNFSHNKHDYVLSYLQKAYDIDSKNADTLYNLGLILYSYNEKVLAKKYLEALPFNEIDIEVEQILKEIQLDEVNKKVELVSLLRRIEHDIELEETKKQLVEFISFNGYQEQEIIETVLKQTVNKEKVLNAIAILSFEYNLHDAIFPYLNKAYELNSSNDDTLFNLGFILAEYGDTKSAIFYFEKMTIKDKDVTDILAKLKGDLYE